MSVSIFQHENRNTAAPHTHATGVYAPVAATTMTATSPRRNDPNTVPKSIGPSYTLGCSGVNR